MKSVRIGGYDVVEVAKATFTGFREDDLQGRAAEVAYNVLFSIVPLLIFLTSLSGFIARAAGADDTMDEITDWLFDNMGSDAASAVRDPIEQVVTTENGGLLSAGAALALWGGKNVVAAIMKSLNVAFDVEDSRPWVKRNLLAIGLTVALGLAIVLASTIFLAGADFAAEITDRIGLGDTWRTVWSIGRWPLIAVILVAAVTALYHVAPHIETPVRPLIPGAVLAVLLWGVAIVGLGFYFANFAGYAGGAYGALGGVLVFVFWLYVMSLILLLGAELSSVLVAAATPATATHPPETGLADNREAVNSANVPHGTYAGYASLPPVAPAAPVGSSRRGSFVAPIAVAGLSSGFKLARKIRTWTKART